MTNLPPEVATARALLRQSAPLAGSKARIYHQVVARRPHRSRTAVRVVTVAFCVMASTSAMAFGYRWVIHRAPAVRPLDVQTQTLPLAPQVPRRHKIGNLAPQKVDAKETAVGLPDSVVPTATGPLLPPTVASQNTSRVGSQRSLNAATPNGAVSPAAPAAVTESELSQQVRDYREAVADMRSNPSLTFEKLVAFRSRWHKSPIAQEVDLRVIEALVALGRRHEAANSARLFVRNYPGSAHAAQMQRIADEVPSSGSLGD